MRSAKRMRLGLLAAAGIFAALLPGLGRTQTLSTDVIGMFPKNIGEFAYADLKATRQLTWFDQLQQQMLPQHFRQFEMFLKAAGIDPASTVDELAWAAIEPGKTHGEEVVGVALGNFNPASAEAFFKQQKLPTREARGYKLFAFGSGSGPDDIFFCFLDSNTAAFGQRDALAELIRVHYGDVQGLLSNDHLFPLINAANGQGTIWAVLNRRYTQMAIGQLLPQVAQFSQAPALLEKVNDTIISAQTSDQIQLQFEAVCASPDDANTLGALLQAGLLYRRYQAQQSDPDLAQMLDSAQITPRGDRLDVQFSLTKQQMLALIQRNAFAVKM
jgi:hypothetical protein